MTVPPADPSPAGKSLQFDSVEPSHAQREIACANCKTQITSVYHKLKDHVLCSSCREALESKYTRGEGSSAGRFGRALMYGVGGGIAGAVVYALVLVYANVEAGLLAVLVGYLVGKGVRKGSGNRGGWRYQALAMTLTYLAVSGAYMPLAFQGEAAGGFVLAVTAVVMAFALPVLIVLGGSWFSGLMLGFALYQAWRLNQRIALPFIGPVQVPVAPVPAAAVE